MRWHAARMGTAARLSRPGPVAERPPAIHRTTGRPDPRRASSTASRVFAPRGDFPRVGHAAEQRIALRCRGVRQLAPPAASVTTGNARLEPFDRRCQCVRRWTTTGGRQLSTSPHLRRMRTTLARVGSRCRRRARIRRLRRGGSPRVARRDPDRACVTASPGVGRRDRGRIVCGMSRRLAVVRRPIRLRSNLERRGSGRGRGHTTCHRRRSGVGSKPPIPRCRDIRRCRPLGPGHARPRR